MSVDGFGEQRLHFFGIGQHAAAIVAPGQHRKRTTQIDVRFLVSFFDEKGQLHTEVFNAYQELLQGGEAQLLMKMKSFWEYLLPDGDRKARKTIHKTSKLANYQSAVSNLLGTY
jgi:hypothetical protein